MKFCEVENMTAYDVVVILVSLCLIWLSIGYIAGRFVF